MNQVGETALRPRAVPLLPPLLAAVLIGLSAPAWASGVDVRVVSDGKGVLSLYPVDSNGHNDTYRAYVEAERGEKYGIRIANRTGRRIGVVVAVDGRNIISGKKSHLRNSWRSGTSSSTSGGIPSAGRGFSTAATPGTGSGTMRTGMHPIPRGGDRNGSSSPADRLDTVAYMGISSQL